MEPIPSTNNSLSVKVIMRQIHHVGYGITPLELGAERILLTLQYVTTQKIPLVPRIRSNLKDAFAYFGPAALIRRKPPER